MNQEFQTEQQPEKKAFYKKWWFWVAIIAVVVVAIVFFSGGDAVQDDLLDYINNDATEMNKLDTKVYDLYEKARNSEDDHSMYTILTNEVIPESQKLIHEAEGIAIETKEVKSVHELYIDAINKQNQAFTLMLSALENGDYVVMTQANEKLDEARKLMRDYETAITELAKEHDVEITYK